MPRRMRRVGRRHDTRGMTLVELVLAIFIFVVASAGILGAYFSCHQLSEHATNTMRAVSNLDDILEHIHSTPFANLQAVFPAGVANGGVANPYATLVGGYALQDEQIVVTYPSQSANRLEMFITVNWTDRGRARSSSISTLRTSSG